jgi:hypothetical protein
MWNAAFSHAMGAHRELQNHTVIEAMTGDPNVMTIRFKSPRRKSA